MNTSNLNWSGSFTSIGTPPGWPSGVNVSVTPDTFSTLPATVTVTVTAYSTAAVGSSSQLISVTATNPVTGQPVTHTMAISLTVSGTPSFMLTGSPTSQTANSQGKASYQLNVTGVNGFGGLVTFSPSGLPNGSTVAFSPSTVSGSGAVVMTVTAPPVVSTTTYPSFAVAATGGSTSQSVQLGLTVNPPSATAPATMTWPVNGSAIPTRLTGGAPFSWTKGLGVSQYNLSVGSSPGASDIFSGTFPASTQGASVGNLPTGARWRT